MSSKNGILKAGFLALAMSFALPIAAQAASPAANDPSFISEVNAAYGTHFQSHAAQTPAQK